MEVADMAAQIAAEQLREKMKWVTVHIALVSILVVPLFILWLVSLCLVRRKHDRARLGFLWMNLATPLFTLGLLLYVITDIIELVWYWGFDIDLTLVKLESWSSWLGSMFIRIAYALLLIALSEIGNGFLYVLTRARSGLQKGVRWGIWALAFVVAVLAIARTGLGMAAWTKYFDFQEDSDRSSEYVRDGSFIRDLGHPRLCYLCRP